jgi:hypothetical protein
MKITLISQSFLIILFQNLNFAQTLNIFSIINSSSNNLNFEKYMLTSGCVLIDLKKDESPSYYFSLNDSEEIFNTNTRPSQDKKYDQKFTSKFEPFNGKPLSISEYAEIKGITNFQALDSILLKDDITEYKLDLLTVHYEPELDFSSCYGAKDNFYLYGWNYSEYEETASIWITRHCAIFNDCSEAKLILNTSTFVNIDIADSQKYDAFLNALINKSTFIENIEGVKGPLQVFKYTNSQDGRKYRIECGKYLDEQGGLIRIYWDSNSNSKYSIYKGF